MPLPTVILPGYFADAKEYRGLEQSLNELGFPSSTVPVRKLDWVSTVGGRSIVPILRLLDRAVSQAREKFNAGQINLIGHSAGGWISRIYLGEKPYTIHGDVDESAFLWNKHAIVANLITLGTPHFSKYERWTRKNLDFVNDNYPGAFYRSVRYICVAGKAVYGQRRWGQLLAYNSYQLTCGQGNSWGDGITPIEAAHLDGAENLVLEKVTHSPQSRSIWYGSPEPLQAWSSYLK